MTFEMLRTGRHCVTHQGGTDVYPWTGTVALHTVITHLAAATEMYVLICTHHAITSLGDF